MTPRPIGELFSIITSSDDEKAVVKSFTDHLDEIFTHPQKDITNHLVHLSDSHAAGLRNSLYGNIYDQAHSVFKEDLDRIGITVDDSTNCLKGRLCKRYKVNMVYDDIYSLGMSLTEKSLHKDFRKLITNAPKKANKTNDPLDTNVELQAGAKNNTMQPPIHDIQATLINSVAEILSIVTALRKENKDLKSKIDLLTTKVDRQNGHANGNNNSLSTTGPVQSGTPPVLTRDSPAHNDPPSPREPPPPQELTLLHQLQQQQQRCDQRECAKEEQPYQQQSSQNGHRAPPLWPALPATSRATPGASGVRQFGLVIQPTQCPAGHRRDCVNKKTCFFRHIGENVGDPVNPEGWNLVSHKKRKPPLYGSKREATTATIAGQRTVREMSIFIGGVNTQLSVDDFSKHVQDHLDVTPVKVSQNKINSYNQSFKLTINSTDKTKIFDSAKWEENIIIKPFRERKNPQNNGYPNTESINSYHYSGPQNFF